MLGAALGISSPQAFDWFHSGYFTTSLGFLMLSMGLTLTFKDFREVGGLTCSAPAKSTCALSPLSLLVSTTVLEKT